MAATNRESPSTEASVGRFIGEDLVSITRDPRRERQRKAAEEEHLKAPLVRSILNYLADKSHLETQAIHDTIIGEAWTTLYQLRLKKSSPQS
jgi:hypothetical protein